jgi:eukaryotic-like serine/threonine-protein kinase
VTTLTDILPPRYSGAEHIARGGMGDIYRATDSVLGRVVAVKLLADRYAWDEDVRRRFTREALAAARLSGEAHIVTIFDVGEHNGRPYIVMEYLSGGSLEDVLREHGRSAPGRALAWLEDAAAALDAAHANGIVHRDVKPGNLLVDAHGDVHVADFGIASAAGMQSLTQPGTVLGTAGYLAPEQAQGETVGPAADRYALAVVAFELLTGTRPFSGDTTTAEAAAHVNAPVPSVSRRNPKLPGELDAVFERALAKDQRGRYPSCGEFVAALRAALAHAAGQTRTVRPVPPPSPPLPPAPTRRRRPGVLALVAGMLLLTGFGGAGVAALLANDGDGDGQERTEATPSTVVTTIVTTTPATTREVTVTTATTTLPTTSTAPTTSAAPTTTGRRGSIAEGVALTDEATRLLGKGRWAEALAVAQRALSMLAGSGQTYEGYANYDVGKALAELGRCEEALPYLERRERLLGPHPDVTAAKRTCTG